MCPIDVKLIGFQFRHCIVLNAVSDANKKVNSYDCLMLM